MKRTFDLIEQLPSIDRLTQNYGEKITLPSVLDFLPSKRTPETPQVKLSNSFNYQIKAPVEYTFKYFDPKKKKEKNKNYKGKLSSFNVLVGKWSDEEDKQLLLGVEKLGRKWARIATEFVKTRSPAACIKRFQQIQNPSNKI